MAIKDLGSIPASTIGFFSNTELFSCTMYAWIECQYSFPLFYPVLISMWPLYSLITGQGVPTNCVLYCYMIE